MNLRQTAQELIQTCLVSAMPNAAVKRALQGRTLPEHIHLVAIGKAAWQMARAAEEILRDRICDGIVITKYGHTEGPIGNLRLREAGHPVPDANTYAATQEALDLVSGLSDRDLVLFLISGGGSALFEQPLIPAEELEQVTRQLLACGAEITEINTIRKRLSAVKGGRFAERCRPARVLSIVLSDVLGDRLDMIASGPACPDTSTAQEAMEIVKTYGLQLSEQALQCLQRPMPTVLEHVETVITGSVTQLCSTAAAYCEAHGFEARVLTASLCCTARDAGSFLASMAQYHRETDHPVAFLAGGETVVKLTGSGMGGRNQELALSAAVGLDGIPNAAIFSFGSDGTDGPTDAAGGYVDGGTLERFRRLGVDLQKVLQDNDAYHALQKVDGLILTGPTGTNVNDLSVLLLVPEAEAQTACETEIFRQ